MTALFVDYIKEGGAALGDRRFCYRCMEEYDMDQHICPHCGFDETTPHNANYIAPGTILRDRYLVGVLMDYNGEGASYIGLDLSTECKIKLREYMPANFCTRVKNKATISVNYNNLAKYKAFMAEYTELNKSLARLRNNSNIEPILDMFADNNTTYTVFEYADGEKMLDYLKDNAGELSWEQATVLFPPLFTTIGILHNSGIIHRAISPDTIYITEKGELKLSAFSVSAVRTVDAGLDHELFKGYAAPEQYSASSSSRQGTWTDVYGVSALLYRCLTGCMPVDSISRMKNDDLCEPSVLNPSVPPHVSKAIMDGMKLSGADRIQTITELVTRLFEQPAVPIKPAAEPVQKEQPVVKEPERYEAPRQPQGYYEYDQRGSYPPPVRERHYRSREDEYTVEKVNMVDRLKVPVIIGVLLLAILVILIAFLWPLFNQSKPDNSSSNSRDSMSSNVISDEDDDFDETASDTEMPDLVGKFYSLCEEKYKDYFKFVPEYVYDDDTEADMIMEQDVEPGTYISQGSTVNLVVSKGAKGGTIPKYDGLTVSQYENELKKAGISNYSLVKSSSTWGIPDTVSQLQIDGKSVTPGIYFSNEDGKKLIVFYISKDANVIPQPVTQAPTVPATTTAVQPQTQAPTAAPTAAPTEPPVVVTDPPAPPPPTDPPIVIVPPTDPPVVTPPDEGDIGVW